MTIVSAKHGVIEQSPKVIGPQDVKREAARRILAICPEWKQRNLTAQAAILAKKGEANWTPEEQSAWASGEDIWSQIAAIRAASDQIETRIESGETVDLTQDTNWSNT